MSNTSLYSHVDKHSRLMYLFVLENKPFSWGLTFCLPGLRNVDKNIYVWCKMYIKKMNDNIHLNESNSSKHTSFEEKMYNYSLISLKLFSITNEFPICGFWQKIQGHIKLMKCSISRTDILWKWCIRFSLNETPSKLISVFFRSAISQT